MSTNFIQMSANGSGCAFFLERKKRFCRFKPHLNQKYCPEHAALLGIDQGRKRIACPLNPKHTCYEDSLNKHLKKCKKQLKDLPPYHSQGINLGTEKSPETDKIPWEEIPTEELQDLISKINSFYDEHVRDVEEDIQHHSCLDEELGNESYGIPAIRHRKQQASLIGHLQKLDLLHDGLCFVELGAGKGNLSHWIQQALPDKSDVGFVLVDYGHVRYKADNKHKWEDSGPKFERLRINIADLDLGKVESICENKRPVVAVGKHLCGSATDLALRCVTKTLVNRKQKDEMQQPELKKFKLVSEKPKASLAGITIALCCHHRCNWDSYVGKKFMEECGFSKRQFALLCKLSGWTAATWTGWKSKEEMTGISVTKVKGKQDEVCVGKQAENYTTVKGNTSETESYTTQDVDDAKEKFEAQDIDDAKETFSDSRQQNIKNYSKLVQNSSPDDLIMGSDVVLNNSEKDKNKQDDLEEHQVDLKQYSARNDLQLSVSQREVIGRKCKRLIDIGRIRFLKQHGMESTLKSYIEEKLTPENVVILAKT